MAPFLLHDEDRASEHYALWYQVALLQDVDIGNSLNKSSS